MRRGSRLAAGGSRVAATGRGLIRWLPLLLLVVAAPAARAWELKRAADGQPRRWGTFPLALRVQAPPAGLQLKQPFDWMPALLAALQTWQEVDSAAASVRYAGHLAPGATTTAQPGEVLLTFDQASFPGDRDVAGLTELFDDLSDSHRILSAHVHLNARDFSWTTGGGDGALDVQSVALHELGHALGIAHPCGDADTLTPSCQALPLTQLQALQASAMWPSTQAGARRTLSPDDRGAVGAAAPLPAGVSSEPAPRLERLALANPDPALLPACAQNLEGLKLALTSSQPADADTLDLQLDGTTLTAALVSRDGSGQLLAQLPVSAVPVAVGVRPARLDALFSSSTTGKGALLTGAFVVADSCAPPSGCSAAGGPGLGALLLLLPLWRRRRTGAARAAAPGRGCARRGPARTRAPAAAALLGAGAVLLGAPPAAAYVRSLNAGGLCTFWSTRGHTFMIDARGTPDVVGTAAFDAIRNSFKTWSAVSCSDLVFPDLGLSQDPADRQVGYVPGGFNRNLVLFRTANCDGGVVPKGDPCVSDGSCGNKYDCWNHTGAVIATTTTTSNRFTGQIADSDIEFNDAPGTDGTKLTFTAVDSPPCSDPAQTNCVHYDIQNTATHEIGHSLGLDHSHDPTATMYATAPEGETAKRTLHPDDVQAICDIYPKGAAVSTCLGDPITIAQTGASDGKGCGCNAAGAGPSLQGALVAALAFSLRPRRRRAIPGAAR